MHDVPDRSAPPASGMPKAMHLTSRQALYAILLIMLVNGASNGHFLIQDQPEPPLSIYFFGFLLSFVPFLWYCRDSDARGYLRSRWLNVLMVTMMPLAVPYYLVRSRPHGRRARALLRLAAFALAAALVTGVGAGLGGLISMMLKGG